MSICSKNTLITISELPTFEGIAIKAIYAQKRDDIFYRTRDLYTGETADFYELVPYFICLKGYKNMFVKTLPESLLKVFGKQEYNGKTGFVKSITYRTSGSGNGSFVDDSISLGGFSFYRGLDKQYSVDGNSEFGKNILATLNTKIDVPHCKEWEYRFYPCSFVRKEGGLNYPDVALDSWRWCYGSPYVSNEVGKKNNIRVWDDTMKAHLYLQLIDTVEDGEENLVCVRFSYHWDKKPDQFCNIQKWNNTKVGAENEIIKYKAHKVKDGFELIPIVNGVEQSFKETLYFDSTYRIMKISFVD